MSLETQIKKLEDQKKALDQKLDILKQKRVQELSQFLDAFDFKDCDTYTLIGLILDGLERLSGLSGKAEQERWHQRGKKFCRSQKTKLVHRLRDQKTPSEKVS